MACVSASLSGGGCAVVIAETAGSESIPRIEIDYRSLAQAQYDTEEETRGNLATCATTVE